VTKAENRALIERELAVVDQALASGSVAAADEGERLLQELALELQADAPTADPAFRAALDRRVTHGFARPRRSRARTALSTAPHRLRHRLPAVVRRPLPAAGAIASLLLAVVVVVSLQAGGSDQPDGGDLLAPGGAADTRETGPPPGGSAQQAFESPGRTAILPPEPRPPGGGFDPRSPERLIERSASMTLAAPGDELERLADEIVAVSDRNGGFVLRSSVTSGDEGVTGGSFDLRIPADRLRQALRELSALGSVRSRTQSGHDVTREFSLARDRLAAARAERRSLLRRLERADSDEEAEAIRRRLHLVASEIRGLRSHARDVRLRADYAAVSVSLTEANGDSGSAGGLDGTGAALEDALDSLAGSLNLALRVLGVALPLGLVALLAWLAGRAVIRRRRESALA
jgi:hypothetical protein